MSAACVIAVTLPLGARAQTSASDYFDLPLEQLLSAEIVTASRRPETVSEAPAAVFVLTRDDILRSGVTSIPEALRLVPGVHVAQVNANSWAISIRGFTSAMANKLLVMIDGRVVYNPLFAGTYWEAQDVLLEDIDRIEVVRGPGGALWGANAVNGVINIRTRHARQTQGHLVTVGYGTHERGFANVRHGGALDNDLFYRIYAKAFDRDSFRQPGGGDAHDAWHSYRGGFRMDWDDRTTLQGDVYSTRAEHRAVTPSLIAPYSPVEEMTVEYKGAHIIGRQWLPFDDGSALMIKTYLDYSRRDEPSLLDDRRVMFDFETQYDFGHRGGHEIIIGAGYRHIYEFQRGSWAASFAPERRNDDLFSAFIQDRIMLVPRQWYLTVGAKFEHNDYSGFEFQPNMRLQWHPNEQQMLWAAVSRAVRTPSRLEHDTNYTVEVADTTPPTRLMLEGNKDFTSERMIAYELGYRNQYTPDIAFDTTVFYNDYDRLSMPVSGVPVNVPAGDDPAHTLVPVWFDNGMSGRAYGLELAASWIVNPAWSLAGSYSLFKLELDAPPHPLFNREAAEGHAPRHMLNLRSSWNLTRRLTLDGLIYYVDRLPGYEVDDYIRLDLNLGWRITDQVRFNLVGQNLLEQVHREFGSSVSANATEIERSIYGKLTWQF